jgi:hypothetical protein
MYKELLTVLLRDQPLIDTKYDKERVVWLMSTGNPRILSVMLAHDCLFKELRWLRDDATDNEIESIEEEMCRSVLHHIIHRGLVYAKTSLDESL